MSGNGYSRTLVSADWTLTSVLGVSVPRSRYRGHLEGLLKDWISGPGGSISSGSNSGSHTFGSLTPGTFYSFSASRQWTQEDTQSPYSTHSACLDFRQYTRGLRPSYSSPSCHSYSYPYYYYLPLLLQIDLLYLIPNQTLTQGIAVNFQLPESTDGITPSRTLSQDSPTLGLPTTPPTVASRVPLQSSAPTPSRTPLRTTMATQPQEHSR